MVAIKKDAQTGDALGTGRRKTSVARVRVRSGKGVITVNSRPLEDYFPLIQHRRALETTLEAAGVREAVDVLITVEGGGPTGQAGACRMGIARALISHDEQIFPAMRDGHFLTRDSRMKERKKYGLRGARRGTQFSKR
jgi:small subunit ribosomal protein S9